MIEIESFVASYSDADCNLIAFAGNGHVGSKLRDTNLEYRTEVLRFLTGDLNLAPDKLVRDLYDAETLHSKSAFSVRHDFVLMLAQELLSRGGEENVCHYLDCVFRAQDSYFSSQCAKLDDESARDAIKIIDTVIGELGDNTPKYYHAVRSTIENHIVG